VEVVPNMFLIVISEIVKLALGICYYFFLFLHVDNGCLLDAPCIGSGSSAHNIV
jgi:hypothetical protein